MWEEVDYIKNRILFFVGINIIIIFFNISVSTAVEDTYKLDPVHSSIVFRIKHLGISYVYGRFHSPEGVIKFDEGNPSNGFVEVTVKASDIDTENADRDNHLRSVDFFDVEKFPRISFKSRDVKMIKDDLYEVAGDMNLHGVTRKILINITRTGSGKDPWGGFRVGAETTFTIKRSDYGMTGMMGIVGDKVELTISIEAVKN